MRADTGRYQAALVVGWTPRGNARRVSRSFDSRAEAVAWLSDQQRELRRGARIDSNATLREAYDDWISNGETVGGWAPATTANYKAVLSKHALPTLGRMRVRDVTAPDVRGLLRDLMRSGASASMTKRVHSYLSMLFLDAQRMGLIAVNPCANVTPPTAPEPEIQRWSEAEITAVVRECLARGDQAARYVLAGLGTGLRTEELLGLTWAAVDLEERTLSVRQVATAVGKKELRVGGKTDMALRGLPFDEFTAGVLARQREYVEELQRARPRLNEKLERKGRPPLPWAGLDLVFSTSRGTILDRGTLRRHVNEIQAAAGVTRIKLYATRSTHGSVLADGGVNLHALAERLGHTDRRYLARKYLRGSEQAHRAIADAVGVVLEAAARCNGVADNRSEQATAAPQGASRGEGDPMGTSLQTPADPN